MRKFSNKYNIKINTTDNIINLLSDFKGIKQKNKFNKSELYFVKNTINFNKEDRFNNISNYAIITKNDNKKEVKLYDKKFYQSSIDDILIASELLLLFDYEILFSIKKKIYKFKFNDINFYIQCINDKDYYLTFDDDTNENCINDIIYLFKYELKLNLDDRLYFDIVQNEFECSKK